MTTDIHELSRSEMEVLKVLWRHGRLSAREVHGHVEPRRGWALSTTRTLLERMVRKGAVVREPFHGVNLYAAAVSRPVGLAALVRDFAERILEIDAAAVVPLLSRDADLSDEELAELERLLAAGDGEAPRD
ncbi:MAG: BlaI/MecI/CopY family transcriptional regulator [Acidobacteria bacterium]|nr:BlaI/MecI/CopY family transcriptional regulator [Acidobacteriota bacterium]